MAKKALVTATALFVLGCTIAAQQQASSLLIFQAFERQCAAPTASNPRDAVVYQRLLLPDGSAQVGSDSRPTPDEAATLMAWRNELKPCRDRRVAASSIGAPVLSAVLATSYTSLDAVYASLASGETSWTEGARAVAAVHAKLDEGLTLADRRVHAALKASCAASVVLPDLDLRPTDCLQLGN